MSSTATPAHHATTDHRRKDFRRLQTLLLAAIGRLETIVQEGSTVPMYDPETGLLTGVGTELVRSDAIPALEELAGFAAEVEWSRPSERSPTLCTFDLWSATALALGAANAASYTGAFACEESDHRVTEAAILRTAWHGLKAQVRPLQQWGKALGEEG